MGSFAATMAFVAVLPLLFRCLVWFAQLPGRSLVC
jgi:hypothetical protein